MVDLGQTTAGTDAAGTAAAAGGDGGGGGGVAFYMLNMEHAQAEANMEIRHSSNVDIFGLKVEGSLPVLWVADSRNITLFGMGGGADAFPSWDTSYYPSDVAKYPPSMIRMERTTGFKLANLFDGGRGSEGHRIAPIGKFPLTPKVLSAYDFYAPDIPRIIRSMWAPWPGYAVPPSKWNLVWIGDGAGDTNATLTDPGDRPVLMQYD